mgnify:CR=1 FL=1
MCSRRVVILLSTYNPRLDLLISQISSLNRQIYENILLVIRDDGSNEKSKADIKNVLQEYYHREYRIMFGANLGSILSFEKLLQDTPDGDLFMFCDQDDIWYENKVLTFVKKWTESGMVPLSLVFGDMTVTDSDENTLSESFWKMQGIERCSDYSAEGILALNPITGCSMMFGSAVRNIYEPNKFMLQHDNYIGLLTLLKGGELIPLRRPTMSYVQHQENQLGVVNYKWNVNLFKKTLLNRLIVYQFCKEYGLSYGKVSYKKIKLNICRFISWNTLKV